MSDIKQQFSSVAKAKDCSQLSIGSLQNEIHFLQEEPNVKDYLLKQAAIAIKTIENNNKKTTTTTTTTKQTKTSAMPNK